MITRYQAKLFEQTTTVMKQFHITFFGFGGISVDISAKVGSYLAKVDLSFKGVENSIPCWRTNENAKKNDSSSYF
jgi:hypothetical protein